MVFGLLSQNLPELPGGIWPDGGGASEEPEDGLLSSFADRLATPAEAILLKALVQELKSDLAAAPPFEELVGDFRLLRTLRAHKHKMPEAAEAFRAHMRKREEFGLDA